MSKLERLLNIVNSELLMEMVKEVNAWDNSLDYLEYIDMDGFDNYLEEYSPSEIANMVHYGYFNPKTEYFRVDRCGYIISSNTYEVLEHLDNCKEEIVKRFIEVYEDGRIDNFYPNVVAILDSSLEEELLSVVNTEILLDMVQEISNWDSSLNHLDFINMEYLNDYLCDLSPIDITKKMYYGIFKPNHPYFRFNECGNLVSYTYDEVSDDLELYKEEIVERFIELYKKGDVDCTYKEVIAILDSEK